MATERGALRSWLIGRDRSLTDRFVVGAAAVYLALLLIVGRIGAVQAYLPIRGYGAAFAIVAVVVASASHAYLNDGLLTGVALAYVLLVGFFAAGVASPSVTRFGRTTVRDALLVEPLWFAVALGALGGALGAAGRRVRERLRGPRTSTR